MSTLHFTSKSKTGPTFDTEGDMNMKRVDNKDDDSVVTPTRNIRSPCRDSHYEAYLLQSRWAVGNLYASNLYLGQTHVKHVQHLDREHKTWLHWKEREQQKLARRLEELQALPRSSSRLAERTRLSTNMSRRASENTSNNQKRSLKDQRLSQGAISTPSFHNAGFVDENSRQKMQNIHHFQGSSDLFYPRDAVLPLMSIKTNEGARRKLGKSVSTLTAFSRGYSSTRWTSRRKTSLSASARLSGTSHNRVPTVSYDRLGPNRLVPKWVPMAYRLQNVRVPNLPK